jgi:tripartite-type tricarboxylate transporter receptor subunit TctC
MTLARRSFLRFAAGAAALPTMSRLVMAQTYPSRPVRVIVSFAAGGPTDILARLIGQHLSQRLGQQFVIENKPGAAGNIGAETVVRSEPDGHTLLMIDATPTISATLYDKLNFNFVRDIAPIAGVARQPQVILVHPSVPAKTLPDLIAYAKANPRKINMASAGIGTPPHMAGELFKLEAGINLVHVPYRGTGAAIADLLGGQVQMAFFGPVASVGYVKSGKLLALAVTSPKRLDVLPDVPSVSEFVPGFETFAWFGVGAPRNTPKEVIELLNKEITTGLTDPKISGRLSQLGATALPLSAAEFRQFIKAETEKWARVIRVANIKPA